MKFAMGSCPIFLLFWQLHAELVIRVGWVDNRVEWWFLRSRAVNYFVCSVDLSCDPDEAGVKWYAEESVVGFD